MTRVQTSTCVLDVSDYLAMQRFAKQVGAKHGTVNLLFNNAGIAFRGLFKDVSLDDMRRVFDVNDWGVVHGCKAFLSLMTRAEAGCVINVSSVYGLIALPVTPCGKKWHIWETLCRLPVPFLRVLKLRLRSAPWCCCIPRARARQSSNAKKCKLGFIPRRNRRPPTY